MKVTLDQAKAFLRKLTIGSKSMITTIVGSVSILQIQEARDFVIKNTVAHPHIATIAVGILGVLTVLHNPTVQKVLHIEETTNVQLPDGTKLPATTTTDAEVK